MRPRPNIGVWRSAYSSASSGSAMSWGGAVSTGGGPPSSAKSSEAQVPPAIPSSRMATPAQSATLVLIVEVVEVTGLPSEPARDFASELSSDSRRPDPTAGDLENFAQTPPS